MTDMNEVILRTERRGHLRYTSEQKQALIEAYETSGLSGPRFAVLQGFNCRTLGSLLEKRRGDDGGIPPVEPLPACVP